MVRLQTRMMAVLRGVVFACLRVNVSMSRTPVSQRVSVAAQRLAMSLCIEWSCEVSCWGVGARMGLVTSTPCMSSPCDWVGTLSGATMESARTRRRGGARTVARWRVRVPGDGERWAMLLCAFGEVSIARERAVRSVELCGGCYERVLSGGDDRRAVHQGDAGWHDGNVHVSTGQYELR